MSSSSRLYGESEGSKVELPVFVTPADLIFATNKRKLLLTVFNPYGSDAQFRIMTTSPDRFDVSVTKGVIKSNRRMEITIRLLSQKIDELPEPREEPQTIDHFRVTLQVGHLRGNRPVRVHWCLYADSLDTEDSHVHLLGADDKGSKHKIKALKTPIVNQSFPTNTTSTTTGQRSFPNQRVSIIRPARSANQVDLANGGSNVNLVCTICAIACVITLFLPLSIDSDLCKKAKSLQESALLQSNGILTQLTALLSVSYEVKLGCSFALGLFTYRLISTLPD